jgi:two-component system sensor histidine kinase KdpD
VSHDLRTPIASIKTAASGLRNDHVRLSADDRAELLGAIEDGADRLASLVDNLLAMSRIQAGALALNLEAVSVEEVVARAVNRLDEHRVHVSTPADLPLIRADEALVERVVANVVENALRFSPPQEPVRIDAAVVPSEPTWVELRVTDRGPGVPPERWDEMFQPFQRLGDTTTGGVGLGLAIARGLTEAMRGTITPTNSPDGGLTMVVRLPVAS